MSCGGRLAKSVGLSSRTSRSCLRTLALASEDRQLGWCRQYAELSGNRIGRAVTRGSTDSGETIGGPLRELMK